MNLSYKNYQSSYELLYNKWNGINFDRDKLIQFIKRLKRTKFLWFIPSLKKEYKILKEILMSYDQEIIQGLLNNDENISRICFIEKWARIAAVDIILTNGYSRLTYTTISNLPLADYKLVLKRAEEIINDHQNIFYQKEKSTDNIPGL
jgi:hypothetical protein